MTATSDTTAATAQRRYMASVRRRARQALVAAGLTHEEIAAAMKVTPSAVRQALLRDSQLENPRITWESVDDGLIWESPTQ